VGQMPVVVPLLAPLKNYDDIDDKNSIKNDPHNFVSYHWISRVAE
jgi:hypothetical protein